MKKDFYFSIFLIFSLLISIKCPCDASRIPIKNLCHAFNNVLTLINPVNIVSNIPDTTLTRMGGGEAIAGFGLVLSRIAPLLNPQQQAIFSIMTTALDVVAGCVAADEEKQEFKEYLLRKKQQTLTRDIPYLSPENLEVDTIVHLKPIDPYFLKGAMNKTFFISKHIQEFMTEQIAYALEEESEHSKQLMRALEELEQAHQELNIFEKSITPMNTMSLTPFLQNVFASFDMISKHLLNG